MNENKPLVSVEWVKNHLTDSNLIILDASLIKTKSGERVTFNTKGIPGTRYFNISEVFSNQDSPYPNMLTTDILFEREIQNLGINSTSNVVIYDRQGIYSSARAWWMFKTMGHQNVSVLNGGLPAWISAKLPVANLQSETHNKGDFKVNRNTLMVWDYQQVNTNIKVKSHCVIDARSEERFLGIRPEPRPQTKSGHIPGSISLHYQKLLDNGFLKSEEEIKQIFNALNNKGKPLVFSCGSGVTACILYLAAYLYLTNEIAVYDGSWTEWGERIN